MLALILIDLQNDFMPWGSIGIEQSAEIIPVANNLMELFDVVIASQDWHPADHISFAANHLWRKPGQIIDLANGPQLLWTMHCVANSFGAEFSVDLNTDKISKIIKKGTKPDEDCYGAFFENNTKIATGLGDYLKKNLVDEVYILGSAAEFGVKSSALDAVDLGFGSSVIADACSWIDYDETNVQNTFEELNRKGVRIIYSDSLKI